MCLQEKGTSNGKMLSSVVEQERHKYGDMGGQIEK
jgi:hypothetical protein